MTAPETPENDEDEMPLPEAFCLTVSLYEGFSSDNEKNNPFFRLEHFKGTLDCYCEE
jgi:hypothetical protein